MNKYTILKDNNVDNTEVQVIVKKSKFIGKVYSINSKEEAETIIASERKRYCDAKHVVYAYTLASSGKFSDDKEPQGTAGKPIYALLEKEKLVGVLIIVIRYFGGILLGTGLLARTYLDTAKKILTKYEKEEYISYENISIQTTYSMEESITKKIQEEKGKVLEIVRDGKVQINAKIPSNKIDIFSKYVNY